MLSTLCANSVAYLTADNPNLILCVRTESILVISLACVYMCDEYDRSKQNSEQMLLAIMNTALVNAQQFIYNLCVCVRVRAVIKHHFLDISL